MKTKSEKMLKFNLLISLLLLSVITISQSNTDSIIQGDWKIIDSKYNICITFESGNVSRRICDSLNPKEGNTYPYYISGEYIEVVPHPLEQIHYKIVKVLGDTLIVDIYYPALKKRDIKNGSPIRKRRRRFKYQQIWIRN